jgi:hypothetical protein
VYQDIIDSPMDIKFTPPAAYREDSALTSKEGCDFVIMGGMYQGNKPWLASQVNNFITRASQSITRTFLASCWSTTSLGKRKVFA